MMKTRKLLHFVIVLLAASICLNCSDGESGDDNENHNCEAECVVDYLTGIPSCEAGSLECMIDCSMPEDTACVESCESCMTELESTVYECMDECSCLGEMNVCTDGCSADDSACMIDCGDVYRECAGETAFFPILDNCISARQGCLEGCLSTSQDMDEYFNCRRECIFDFNDCILDMSE